jgi:hypothetical protein
MDHQEVQDLAELMDHQEVQVQVEHLVQMDHQEAGSSGTSGAKWIIRKCRFKGTSANGSIRKRRFQWKHLAMDHQKCRLSGTSGANGSSGSADRGANGSSGSAGQGGASGNIWCKWIIRVQDQVEHLDGCQDHQEVAGQVVKSSAQMDQ